MISCPCCVYRAVFNEAWPEDWHFMRIAGLTDPRGKTVYIADGLPPEEAHITLLHEFLHVRGLHEHNEEFLKAEEAVIKKAARLGVRWDDSLGD